MRIRFHELPLHFMVCISPTAQEGRITSCLLAWFRLRLVGHAAQRARELHIQTYSLSEASRTLDFRFP